MAGSLLGLSARAQRHGPSVRAGLWVLEPRGLQAGDQTPIAGGRLLGEVYGRSKEGFDTPDLREATALLDELA